MKRRILAIIILTFFIIIIPPSYARTFSVGVSPSVLNLGDVERGESKIGRFYIVTSSDEELLVYLENMRSTIDFFNKGYGEFLLNYSEEDTLGWIEFLRNPVELKPSGELKTSGGSIKGWKEIEFILNVPEDAEPGYHTAAIRPLPRVPKGQDTGVVIRTVTTLTVLFKVPGKAVREGGILDTSSGDYSGNNLGVNVFFKNTGTVTISASVNSVKISDVYGRDLGSLISSPAFVKPGETVPFKALWDVRGLDVGSYYANATVCYTTGCTNKASAIQIYTPVEAPMVVYPEIGRPFPWFLLIVVAIIIISYLVYRRRE